MTDPDDGVIEAIRAGNPRRFSELVDRHRDRALTLAIRIVGSREEAEELVQDSFVRAYRALQEFRGEARFGTWFTRILYNVCLTRVDRRRDREIAVEEEQTFPAPAEETDLLARMEEEELRAIIAEEIMHLPEKYRTVITLFYQQELTYGEIAGVTRHPLGTVKTYLLRGRAALRRRVHDRIGESTEAA